MAPGRSQSGESIKRAAFPSEQMEVKTGDDMDGRPFRDLAGNMVKQAVQTGGVV